MNFNFLFLVDVLLQQFLGWVNQSVGDVFGNIYPTVAVLFQFLCKSMTELTDAKRSNNNNLWLRNETWFVYCTVKRFFR